jgi:transcription-repair coupling factor (superfamily II helicase)
MSVHFNFDSTLHGALAAVVAPAAPQKISITAADPLFSAALLLSSSISAYKASPNVVVVRDAHEAQRFVKLFKLLSRFSGGLKHRIHTLPPHDISPYSGLYSNRGLMLQRLNWLFRASFSQPGDIFVAPIKALAQKTLPQDVLLDHVQEFKINDELPSPLGEFLSRLGYQSVPLVEDPGTYSVRGGIVDIFSPSQKWPVRIELFGDQIESLRFFDPHTQRSLEEIRQFDLIPAHEILFSDDNILRACQKLDGLESETDIGHLQMQIRTETYFDGIEFLLPYFYKATSAPTEYFSQTPTYWWPDAVTTDGHLITDLSVLAEEFEQLQTHLPPPTELYLETDVLLNILNGRRVDVESLEITDNTQVISLAFNSRAVLPAKAPIFSERLDMLTKKTDEWKKARSCVLIFGNSETQFKRVQNAFEAENLHLRWVGDNNPSYDELKQEQTASPRLVHFIKGELDTSYQSLNEAIVFVSFEHYLKKTEARRSTVQNEMSKAEALSFSELREGDPVVHVQHGVGIYLGLKVMNIGGVDAEFLELKFKDNDKLFLPIYRLNQVHKYTGAGSNPVLDRLGGKGWEKTKAKVQKRLREIAAELVQLYAKRLSLRRPPYQVDTPEIQALEDAFPYEETVDQLRAINDIKKDLSEEKPMDRLICGDVGFGKTEVAMRAAFIAASQGRQVAVLAPTTILTFQHFETFKKRYKDTAIRVAVINRFVSGAEAKKTLEALKLGQIDVMIGTHRLLSQDVVYKNLGLLVIDEEQKFGVKHKEKIRYMKNHVDTLAMSATPIPRTLNMSLLGIRDLSLINTPPNDRLPTRTFVSKFDMPVIKKSVLDEVKRGGQVFFLHNRVHSIYELAGSLRAALPNVKMAVAHGQMDEHELEKTIVSFFNKEIDMLVCTTIIESGMDIPNANTMFVDQAQALGLSQLYQLRGRVGRSKQRAFCYLLIPRHGKIDDVAKERLRILQQNTALGSEMQIAQYDLELRGAGTLLGEEQSGTVDAIGYEMYMDLLEQAIHEAKGDPLEEVVEPEINLKIKALIPHAYMPDIRLRLSYYKALSSIQSVDDLDKIENDLRDQFGAPPEEVFNLMGMMMIRHICKELGIRDVSSGPAAISLVFTENTKLPAQKVVELSLMANKKYSITPDNRLKIRMNEITWQNIFEEVSYLKKLTT